MRSTTILPADDRQAVKDSWSYELKSKSRFKIISTLIHTLSVYTDKIFPGNGNSYVAKQATIWYQIISTSYLRKENNGQVNISNSKEVEIDIASRWKNLSPTWGSLQILFHQQRSGVKVQVRV